MDLVVCTVFKTAEAFARGLVGSIPTLSRHDHAPFAARTFGHIRSSGVGKRSAPA